DVVDAGGVDHLLVGVQADVGAALDVHLVLELLGALVLLDEFLELAAALLEAVLEGVAQSDDGDALGSLQPALAGAPAAAAAADDADLDLVVTRGVDAAGEQRRRQRGARDGDAGLEELAAVTALLVLVAHERLPRCPDVRKGCEIARPVR